jgi:hypothetical protein
MNSYKLLDLRKNINYELIVSEKLQKRLKKG